EIVDEVGEAGLVVHEKHGGVVLVQAAVWVGAHQGIQGRGWGGRHDLEGPLRPPKSGPSMMQRASLEKCQFAGLSLSRAHGCMGMVPECAASPGLFPFPPPVGRYKASFSP